MSIFPKINTISALKEYSRSDLLVVIRKLNYQGGGAAGRWEMGIISHTEAKMPRIYNHTLN